MKILVFDTETTGLPTERNASIISTDKWPYIVQISYLIFDTEINMVLDYVDKIILTLPGRPYSFEIPWTIITDLDYSHKLFNNNYFDINKHLLNSLNSWLIIFHGELRLCINLFCFFSPNRIPFSNILSFFIKPFKKTDTPYLTYC